jgi:ribosomal protein S18 acetylase RimI-like enzyme
MSAVLPVDAIDGIRLRPMRAEDQPFLRRLYGTVRDAELRVTGWDDAQKRAFLDMQFEAQTRGYRDSFPDARFDVVEVDGTAVGRMTVSREGATMRLVDVALLPEHCGRGTGGRLLRALQAEAAATGSTIVLHVENYNPALRLYVRLGFGVVDDNGLNLRMTWSPPEPAATG